ncbi:MAG TPA: DNA internalization-related competence protein ComEC/Rec2, partial [Phycisphaerales bacterium]|nr:DNA internalization-related competence protein ComEC/Rec2 [Phycisphaerales bacterium]
ANFHKQIISTAPLLFAAIGLIAGILIQNVFGLSIRLWLILLAFFAIVTSLLFAGQRFSFNNQLSIINNHSIIAYLALACFACLGAVRLTSFYQPAPNDIRHLIGDERRLATEDTEKEDLTQISQINAEKKLKLNSAVSANSAVKQFERTLATIRGLIITEPRINNSRQWEFAKFKPTDPASSFYLKLHEVKTVAGWAKAAGTVRVQVAEPVLDLKAGDYIQAYCWLDRFKQAANPGQFDTAEYLARKNVFIAASVKSRDGIELLRNSPAGIFTKVKEKLRETATNALLGNLSLEDRSRGLLEALLLGYRANIDSDTYRAFRKTGLLHFISLSGMHLGILVGIIWWLCKTAGLMKRWRAAICIIAIVIFLLIVPPRAPTLRAAIIAFVFCISFFFRRHSNPLNTLSLAAIILLLIRPTALFEAGFQLSFASVLGIIFFANRIHFFLYEKLTNLPWFKETTKTKLFFRIISKPVPYLLRLFSIGLAAWLGGAGVLLYHFYTINPLTSLWTVITFPFVAMILILGYLKIALSFLLPTAAWGLGIIVNFLSDSLIWVVERIANSGLSQILIGRVSLAPIILYYCFILFAGFAYFRWPLIKKTICTAMVLAIIVFLSVTKWQRINRDNLIITALDVGHGQAILAQLPGKANILFDSGSLYTNDVGGRIVTPFLNYSGINKIDAIIISHNDIDHINGIPEIIENCNVDNVYANDAFFSKVNQPGTAKFLNDSLREKGLKIQPLGRDLNLSSSTGVEILWPSEQAGRNEQLADNDKSQVTLIEFAGKKILLCSDIEKFAQRQLLRLYPNLKADIVIVPHHGSVKTTDADFLENLKADILIYSCSRRQYERTSRDSLPVTRAPNKAKLFYTARDGAITVYINRDGTIKLASRNSRDE